MDVQTSTDNSGPSSSGPSHSKADQRMSVRPDRLSKELIRQSVARQISGHCALVKQFEGSGGQTKRSLYVRLLGRHGLQCITISHKQAGQPGWAPRPGTSAS